MGIFFVFLQKETGAKELLRKQHSGSHFVSFLMHIYGAKFQEHCFNISRDIVSSVFHHFLVVNKMTSSLVKFA